VDIKSVFMGLAFSFMWSSAFTSARIIVSAAPPLTSLSVRFLISGLIGILIARALGQSWNLSKAQWRATILFGLCQNALYLGLNFVAMQTVEASVAAIIASTLPLLVAILGIAVFGEKLRPLGAVGLLAGLAGVIVIMGSRLGETVPIAGLILCVLGVLALTFATLSVNAASTGGNVLMIVGLQMLVGSAILACIAIPTETITVDWSWKLIAAFAYTVFVPGLGATWIWFVLVGRIGTLKASAFHFLNPFLGVAIAWALLGEKLGSLDLFGVAIIGAGILAVQLSKQSKA
jgi:drug/metabolite transporter (DMT)-like permease